MFGGGGEVEVVGGGLHALAKVLGEVWKTESNQWFRSFVWAVRMKIPPPFDNIHFHAAPLKVD